jgi:hypothetical protein
MIRPFKWVERFGKWVERFGRMLDALYQPKEGLFRESALCWFLGLCLGCILLPFVSVRLNYM